MTNTRGFVPASQPAPIPRAPCLSRHDEPGPCGVVHESLLLGDSEAMRLARDRIELSASLPKTVLITGETGTGKEVAAEEIHRRSHRAAGPLVVINCGAIPQNLAESELFGHVAGAFSGAQSAHVGVFEQANGGTLFLDEVGELPLDLQVKLLRAVEKGRIRPVGSDRERPVDVRVIAATNRDLEEEVRAGRFRADLFYRLRGLPIRLPALRDRLVDLPLLVRHFLDVCSRPDAIDAEAIALLSRAAWPGNVRELKSVAELAGALERRVGGGPVLSASGVRAALGFVEAKPVSEGRELIARGIRGCVAEGDLRELESWMHGTLYQEVHEAEDGDVERTAARLDVSTRMVRRGLLGGGGR